MAVTLNLMPQELVVTGSWGKILKTLRMLNVILLSGFLIFALGVAAFFIFSSLSLRSMTAQEDSLKAEIATQVTVEQQIVLLKDRIAKIKKVQTLPSSAGNLDKLSPLLGSTGQNSSLSELDVDPKKIDVSIIFKTNSDLSNFMKNVLPESAFKNVSLSSFSFSPVSGYLAAFNMF